MIGSLASTPTDGMWQMRVVKNLPAAFERFKQIGGALHFVVYEDAHGGDAEAIAAMAKAVPGWRVETPEILNNRQIDRPAFFGEWYDAATRSLLMIGQYTTGEGKVIVNPKLRDLTIPYQLQSKETLWTSRPRPNPGSCDEDLLEG